MFVLQRKRKKQLFKAISIESNLKGKTSIIDKMHFKQILLSQTQETAFHYVAFAGNNDTLTELISHMTQTEVQKALNRQTSVGWTPLLIACHHGHMDMVNTLLANHARVDVFDIEGRSALHLAADRGYLQVNIF